MLPEETASCSAGPRSAFGLGLGVGAAVCPFLSFKVARIKVFGSFSTAFNTACSRLVALGLKS